MKMIPGLCEVCADGMTGNTATSYCEDCKEGMCEQCSKCHRRMKISRMHTMRPIAMSYELYSGVEAKETCTYMCEQHQKESEEFCRECSQIVCVKCASEDHDQHKLCNAREVTDKFRESLQRECDELNSAFDCNRKLAKNCDEQLAEFVRSLETAEKRIADRTEAIKELVERTLCFCFGETETSKT